MFFKQFFKYLLAVTSLFFEVFAFGVSQNRAINISYLSLEDGLSNNSVTSIFKDNYGFMWIGTYDGLNRYDGYDFVTYRNILGDSTSLTNNRIVSIHGKKEWVWVGTKKGLCSYNFNTDRFKRAVYVNNAGAIKPVNIAINQVNSDSSNVYVATAGLGVLKNSGSGFEQIPYLDSDEKKIFDYHAQALEFDPKGDVWVFIQGVGLARYSHQTQSFALINRIVLSAHSMCIIANNEIWLGLDNGVFRYFPERDNGTIYSQTIIRHHVTDLIYLPEEREVWAATDGNGIIGFNLNKEVFFEIPSKTADNALSSRAVYSLYLDEDKSKWVGTLRGGINILGISHYGILSVSSSMNVYQDLVSDFILSFCEQRDGKIWIGTDGGGASLWDNADNRFTTYQSDPTKEGTLPSNFVTNILQDNGGRVWFATYGGGVCRLNQEKKIFESFDLYNPNMDYIQKNAWVLYEDNDQQLWASTVDGQGLFKYNDRSKKFDFTDIGFGGIIELSQGANGKFWAGTFTSLVKLDLLENNHSVFDVGYPVRSISHISSDSILVGTEGGGILLLDADGNVYEHYTQSNGLSNNSVLKILSDSSKEFWFSTYNGLGCINLSNGAIVNYYETDGLQSNQFNYNAALKLMNGNLVFGGIKGFNIIDPSLKNRTSSFPNVFITDIKVNNEPISSKRGQNAFSTREVKLQYDESMLSINFVGLEYKQPKKIEYAYFLEGWDREWHEVGSSRIANYSKIQPGEYTFRVKTTNADGVWSNADASLSIIIFPPWYLSAWAYFFYSIVGAVAFKGVLYYQRGRTRLQYDIKLSRELAQKNKELNEKKLTFFTNISHEVASHLTMIVNPLKDVIYGTGKEIDGVAIEVAYQNSKRLLSLTDQLLMFRKAESEIDELKVVYVDLLELTQEVFTCFAHQANRKNVEYIFNSDLESCFVYIDRQKLEIALFNLISNALKFADQEKGKVVVHIRRGKSEIIITVDDNGKGVNKKEKSSVFDLFYQSDSNDSNKRGFGIGLYLVRKFIQQNGGQVMCWDSDLGGAQFEVRIKSGKDHFISETVIYDDVVGEHYLLLDELLEEINDENEQSESLEISKELIADRFVLLVIDDNAQIREYLRRIFKKEYNVLTARNAEEGMGLVRSKKPDLVISDVVMEGMSGVDFCKAMKLDESVRHIPIILMTASRADEIKLKGAEVGSDDYISKPFDKDYLMVRVKSILKRQELIQSHLLSKVTKNQEDNKLSEEDKKLLDKVVSLIEVHMKDEDFNIKLVAEKIGMSHSLLYRRIKQITGKSVNEFVRFVRLRTVASLLITTDAQVNEAVYRAGFSDLKYFRKQFYGLYGMNPSEFKKKYKNALKDKHYILNESLLKYS